jgi:hypothetical protein
MSGPASNRAGARYSSRRFGEPAVAADAVAVLRQHMRQEAADDRVNIVRHRPVSLRTFDAVILPLKRDASMQMLARSWQGSACRPTSLCQSLWSTCCAITGELHTTLRARRKRCGRPWLCKNAASGVTGPTLPASSADRRSIRLSDKRFQPGFARISVEPPKIPRQIAIASTRKSLRRACRPGTAS